MSVFFDALKKAQQVDEPKNVVQVPRKADARDWMLLTALFCLLATGLSIWSDRQENRRRDAALAGKITELETRHNDFVSSIHTDDAYLDTRTQLDVMELKQGFRALTARFDSFREERESMAAENASMREELKSEMQTISGRLHRVEHDHSELSDRLDAVAARNS